jgi:Family of unknown function (DUF6709)
MWDKFIGEQIRRVNRNLLITNVVILVVAATLLLTKHDLINGYLRGGEKVEASALARMTAADRGVIEVNADGVIPTGYAMVKHRSSGKDEVEYEFVAMRAGDRLLLVKVEQGQKGPHFAGTLESLPNQVMTMAYQDMKTPKGRAALMPIMLDTIEYKSDAWLLMGLGILAIPLALWNLKKWMQRAADPATSPIVTQQEHRGGVMACQQVDSEVAQSCGKLGKALLTKSWVIVPHTYHATIMHLEDVVWVYKKVTQHRVNFIPTGKTYAAMLCASNGAMVQVDDKQEKIDQLLATIAAKAPWAIAGFSDDVQKLWQKNRDALLQAVNQRRSELRKKAAAAAVAAPALA